MVLVCLIPTSCNGYNRFAEVRNRSFLQFKCEMIFDIIVDLQRI
jgi:hypothetical protein